MAVKFYDNFTGTTIDTNKWTETDPNSWISQNNVINIALPHSSIVSEFTNNLTSVSSITSGTAVVQGNITWTTDSSNEAMGGIYLWKDNNNYAFIGSRATGGRYRLRIVSGGSSVYSLETSIAKGKDVKIVSNGTQVSFYYWSGSSWTQIGTTQTVSLGYNLKYIISSEDYTGRTGANPITIDNSYFSDQDYTTQYPATTSIKSIDGLDYASIKSFDGLAMSSVKSVDGLA